MLFNRCVQLVTTQLPVSPMVSGRSSTGFSHDCVLNRLFRRRSKKTSKLRVTGLSQGNSTVIGECPAQRASDAENVSI